jgi:hypothetical protein
MGAASSPQMQRRAMACADGATRQAAAGDERRAAAPPGDSLMQLSNAATKLSQEGEAGAGGAGDGGAAAPDSLTLSMPELLPSQGAELPSQPDIPIPVGPGPEQTPRVHLRVVLQTCGVPLTSWRRRAMQPVVALCRCWRCTACPLPRRS